MGSSSEKRCLYEVLGVSRDCSADEIRSAYRKLALQRHPDKLVQSGQASHADATSAFQELVNAYEVLSDPRERAWYDSHRSQILFSDAGRGGGGGGSSAASSVPDLFSYFSKSVFSGYTDSNRGFYKVYSDVFDKIYSNELNFAKKLGLRVDAVKEAPLMGNLESPYTQVTAFYNYWLGFATVMDFCWADQYNAMAGPNRKSRRVMEEENKKIRKKAKREYNETVRSLAEFVKKRDKRVIDMQVKRNEEMERKREHETKKKKELERQRLERAMAYKEPDWAKVEDDGEIEEDIDEAEDDAKELFCAVCRKKFKSEKQWKNHEQSKKHKEKVAELREAYSEEEIENDEGEETGEEEDNIGMDELSEKFGGSVKFQKQDNDDGIAQSSEEEEEDSEGKGAGPSAVDEVFESGDDEASILEAMISGHKSKKNASVVKAKTTSMKTQPTTDSDDMDFMAYNNMKSTRRKRGGRGERGRRHDHDDEETTTADATEAPSMFEEKNGRDGSCVSNEISAHVSVEKESNGKVDDNQLVKPDVLKQPRNGKGAAKKDSTSKLRSTSKGRKQKATSKTSGCVCDTCGVDFESRNRLYKHLGESGHATLKSRCAARKF